MEDEAITGLRDISDPLERARRAHEITTQAQDLRDEAIADANRAGAGPTEISRAIGGLTPQRISQILKEGPPAERAFYAATGCVTVAVGRKTEAPKESSGEPGPVIAVEDAAAREMLRDHLDGLGLTERNEEIAPPGLVDLNRDGLVVICGPRLSPLVAQVLASDRILGFGNDGHGWHIEDRETAATWRSPLDDGQPGDVGYLGRLPRPDGRGTFIYMAGIHAAGAAGAVHWLAGGGLAELWREVRLHRFSTLIRCEFDPATRAVTSSERVTPLYRQEN